MGLGFPFGSARRSCGEATARVMTAATGVPRLPNPDPKKFEVLQHKQIGTALAVMVRYHGCTNYEGVKIMVYRSATMDGLKAEGVLDPHFCEHVEHSPVARFVPTEDGWKLALRLCRWLAKEPT